MHEWSQRTTVRVKAERARVGAVTVSSFVRRSIPGPRMIPGGSTEARSIYPQLYWEKNDSRQPHLDFHRFPLDILVVDRVSKPDQFFVDDPKYQKTASTYHLIKGSCVVCDRRGSIMNVFLTSKDVPSLERVSTQARKALEEAKEDLKPRHSFAVGGDYTRDPDYHFKVNNMQMRMAGTIWNDGLQTYTTPSKAWGGMYFTQYFRRKPHSDPTTFSLPYISMYAVEEAVVPAIADARYKLLKQANLPCAFPGLPCRLMPATQVGISEHFSVKTHADSCISSVTETIFWANHNVKNARFAVTSLKIAFDIGTQPCILFQKGNEMHGTVPGTKGSCGLVLISKRNTLQQFERGAYTDRTMH